MIHTIGDSHSINGWRHIGGVCVHHLGAITAYRVGRDGKGILNVDGLVSGGDTVVTSFGEIDCRCHLLKHVGEAGDLPALASRIAMGYMRTIIDNAITNPGVSFVVFGIPPTVKSAVADVMPDTPYLGSDSERVECVKAMNGALSYQASQCGGKFLDIHGSYSDPDGTMNMNYSDDGVHIKDPVFIVQELRNMGIM